jgi:aldose 1-epimerase
MIMSIQKTKVGISKKGKEIFTYTIKNKNGSLVEILNYGGIVRCLKVPDKNGEFADIVLGYDKAEQYMENNYSYFGALIGRFANRIENGEFYLGEKKIELEKNEGNNHLHGGFKGLDKVFWNTEIKKENDEEFLNLSYHCIDGKGGYPGNVDISVNYKLTNDDELVINYYAISDKDTILNLTNHSYFNLKGHNMGSILNHKVIINSDFYTSINSETLPNGEILRVEDTPLDLRKKKVIGENINSDFKEVEYVNGYDHNFILNKENDNKLFKAAEVSESGSGRIMEVYTTKPAIQFYTGNYLNKEIVSKENTKYQKYSGFCLETQYYPDSPNYKHFTSPILKKGEEYKHTTIYKFKTKK